MSVKTITLMLSWFNQFMSCSFLPPYFFFSRNTTHEHVVSVKVSRWVSAFLSCLTPEYQWVRPTWHADNVSHSTHFFRGFPSKVKVQSEAPSPVSRARTDMLVLMFWWNICNLPSHPAQLVVIAQIAFLYSFIEISDFLIVCFVRQKKRNFPISSLKIR